MKKVILVVALMMAASAASATGWGIVGGVIVKPSSGAPAVITFDGTELFTSQAACDVQRQAYLVEKVTTAGSNTDGSYPPFPWAGLVATKIDATRCIKVTP
jgi:hypothetical protein